MSTGLTAARKMEAYMSAPRFSRALVAAGIVATAVVLAGGGLSKAANTEHLGHAQHMQGIEAAKPTMPGQEVFGTIQEIVQILEGDPATDWSKVNIAALREHLIDMDEVTMRAAATERPLVDGVEISVTGEGRTLEAIKRMLPAHANELGAVGWSARTESLSNGIKLVVTSRDPKDAIKLKALGFIGIMVEGAHHQIHHLMMAKGEFAH
jgi:hypothetical protein